MPFAAITEVNDTGYPRYRRRSPLDGGRTVQLAGRAGGGPVQVDNRRVVPYNPLLSRALDRHVNVKIITHAVTCIKYVIKYVTKGIHQVELAVTTGKEVVVDKIVTYPPESHLRSTEAACWSPSVSTLLFGARARAGGADYLLLFNLLYIYYCISHCSLFCHT